MLLKKSQKKEYVFKFNPHGKKVKSVELAGEMNDWNPKKTEFMQDGDEWKVKVEMNPGIYRYQLVVDGKWMLDPANLDSVDNNNGGFNSVFETPDNSLLSPRLATDKIGRGSFSFSIENNPEEIFVLFQNTRIKINSEEGSKRVITVQIPDEAKQMHRAFIRVFACNKARRKQ